MIPNNDLKLRVFLVSENKIEGTDDKSLRNYKDKFLYAKLDRDNFDYTFKTNQTFREVKQIVSNITNIPTKMMSIGKWDYYDEKTNTTYFNPTNYNDDILLNNSCFNQRYTETRYIYIIIDENKSENHQIFNNIYEDSNKKYEESNKIKIELENENKNLKNQIDNLERQSENKFRNIENSYKKQIQNIKTSHKQEIERIKIENSKKIEENYRKNKKEFELYSNIEKERNKAAQEKLMGKIKTIEDKQRLEKEAEIKNEEEAELELKMQVEEIKNNFYKEFENNLIFEIKKFCLLSLKKAENKVDLFSNRLVKLLHKSYDNISLDIFKRSKQDLSVKTEEIYKNKIMQFLDDQFNGNNHINTIAIGQAGVGKSTLINNILKIKGTEFEAKTGKGKSVTKEYKIYTSEKILFLSVYDTPGLDFNLDIKELFKNIKSIVENKLKTNNPDEFINCIWYCISGDRCQEEEVKFITEIMKLYSSSFLPIIIVLLRIGNQDYNELKESINNLFKNTNEENLLSNIKFCRVVSEDIKDGKKVLIEATGFKELLNLTKNGIKNSVESALYENIKNRIKNACFEFTGIINKSIDDVYEDDIEYLSKQTKLLDKLCNIKNNIEDNEDINSENSSNSNDEINLLGESEYEKNNYYENFTIFMSQKLEEVSQIIKNNYSPKRETTILKRKIQEYLQNVKKIIINMKSFIEFYEKLIIKESEILSKRIIEKQNEIDFKRKSKLSQRGYQWNKICKEEIDSKYKEFTYMEFFKNTFAIFNHGCLFNFKNYVNDLFDEIINKKENNDLLLNKAKKCMNNLVEDIKVEFDKEDKKDNKFENKEDKQSNNINDKDIENKNDIIEEEVESEEAVEGNLDI